MPVVAVVSSKGGAGKSTCVLSISLQLARGAPVIIIDADPNHPIKKWEKNNKNVPANLTVIDDVDEDNISDKIEAAAKLAPFVLVDLEGTAAKIVVMAVQFCDFVIVPMQCRRLDADQAARALKVIHTHEAAMRRQVPNYTLDYAILKTRTSPVIRSRMVKRVERDLEKANIKTFKSEMNERDAFAALFEFNESFDTLDPEQIPNIDKAIRNAEDVAKELIAFLKPKEASSVKEAA